MRLQCQIHLLDDIHTLCPTAIDCIFQTRKHTTHMSWFHTTRAFNDNLLEVHNLPRDACDIKISKLDMTESIHITYYSKMAAMFLDDVLIWRDRFLSQLQIFLLAENLKNFTIKISNRVCQSQCWD